MKIICIGRNYAAHARELNNEIPEDPVFFLKPDTSLLRNNAPFYYPDFSQDIHHEVEIVLKINRLGKNISRKFAHRYFDEIGIGIDFTARDLQNDCKQKGLPWEIAKAFEHAAPLGKFLPKSSFSDLNDISLRLDINGKTVQRSTSAYMLFPFDRIIEYVSRFFPLKMGDLIYTGTPEGVGPVHPGDHLQAYLNDQLLLDFKVK
jgi:acylpyruvate hydrolase